jgi:hypothetical protein
MKKEKDIAVTDDQNFATQNLTKKSDEFNF